MKLPNRTPEIIIPAICLVLLYSLSFYEFNDYSLGFYNSWLNQILVYSRCNVIFFMWIWLIWRGIDDTKPFGWWMAFKRWMCSLFFLLLVGEVIFESRVPNEKVLYTLSFPKNTIITCTQKFNPVQYYFIRIRHSLFHNFAYREKLLWQSIDPPSKENVQALLEREGVYQ